MQGLDAFYAGHVREVADEHAQLAAGLLANPDAVDVAVADTSPALIAADEDVMNPSG